MREVMILACLVMLACTDGRGEAAREGDGAEPADSPTSPPVLRDADGDGYIVGAGDCDDDDASIHPNAEEICDGVDQDCDGKADNNPRWDADGDGYASPLWCESAEPDCDDTSAAWSPGADEQCQPPGGDEDCDEEVDEGC